MAENRAATCVKLRTGGFPAHVFAPSHFAGVLIKMGPRDMVMLADLRSPQPGEIALRLVCAGAIRAIRLAMIDPLHLKACMKILAAGPQNQRPFHSTRADHRSGKLARRLDPACARHYSCGVTCGTTPTSVTCEPSANVQMATLAWSMFPEFR